MQNPWFLTSWVLFFVGLVLTVFPAVGHLYFSMAGAERHPADFVDHINRRHVSRSMVGVGVLAAAAVLKYLAG